ncbi:hypothetical protein SNEBB_010717 [Seison nebaliae]|nr:hypothetical protein SNEBB_010717 [Seison nebaliae]
MNMKLFQYILVFHLHDLINHLLAIDITQQIYFNIHNKELFNSNLQQDDIVRTKRQRYSFKMNESELNGNNKKNYVDWITFGNSYHVFNGQSLDIICDDMMNRSSEIYYKIYSVSKSDYENCKLTKLKDFEKELIEKITLGKKVKKKFARLLLTCSPERSVRKRTILVSPIKMLPGTFNLIPNNIYYFITTSDGTKNGINNEENGLCEKNNMKLKILVHSHLSKMENMNNSSLANNNLSFLFSVLMDMKEKEIDGELKTEKDEEDEEYIVLNTAQNLMKYKVKRLMEEPEKPVIIPEMPKNNRLPRAFNPHMYIRNIMGASSGAGSGEFDIYRGIRRRQKIREAFMLREKKRLENEDQYNKKILKNQKEIEEQTEKKRNKRRRRAINRSKKNKLSKNDEISQDDEDEKQDNTTEILDDTAADDDDDLLDIVHSNK